MSPTVGDLAAFSVNQEAALSVCDARRDALVSTIDAANALSVPKPRRPWWKLF